jgi:serine/threonine protein kinase
MEYVEGVPIDRILPRAEMRFGRTTQIILRSRRRCLLRSSTSGYTPRFKAFKYIGNDGRHAETARFRHCQIARKRKRDKLNVTENRLLTPQYASPEQIRGEAIGTPADVYSLGIILYELLTGQYPYRVKTTNPLELARVISEQEPVKPSSAASNAECGMRNAESENAENRKFLIQDSKTEDQKPNTQTAIRLSQLKGDLDTIILKALDKDVHCRYASAEQLSEDIRRYLKDCQLRREKIIGATEAGNSFGRYRLAVAAAAVVLLTLIVGIVATSYQTLAANRERALAEKRFNDVRRLSNSVLCRVSRRN